MREFNQSHFEGISNRVDAKRKELVAIQQSILSFPTPSLIELQRSLTLELYDLMLTEESFYKQKSCVDWIHKGDQNTKYFQNVVVVQQRRGLIRSLTDANGVQLFAYNQISNEAVDFFKKLIRTTDHVVSGSLRNILTELLHVTIIENAALELCKPISNKEKKKVQYFLLGVIRHQGHMGSHPIFSNLLGPL